MFDLHATTVSGATSSRLLLLLLCLYFFCPFTRLPPSAQWQRKNKQTKNTFFLCSLAIDLETLSSSSAAQLGSAAARQLGNSAAIAYFIFFRYLFFLSLLLPRAFCTARSGKDLRNIDRYCPRLNLDSCERGKQKAKPLGGKLRGTERVETILKYAIECVYIFIYKFIYIHSYLSAKINAVFMEIFVAFRNLISSTI